MAIESTMGRISIVVANASLATSQFLAVKVATADLNVVLASTGGENILGVLENKPAAGAAADVCFSGVSKGVAGAAYTRGTVLMTDTSGRFITATSTNQGVAYALESAGAAGEIHPILVQAFGKQ